MPSRRALSSLIPVLVALAGSAGAQTLPCAPCAGLRAPGPEEAAALAGALAERVELEPGTPVFLAWEAELGGDTAVVERTAAAAQAVRGAGAVPWISLVFRTPPPLLDNLARLDAEVAAAAAIARRGGAGFYQVVWRPEGGGAGEPGVYGYLLKRAAVAVSGAEEGARLATGPLPADPAALDAFYGAEVAGYLEALALAPAPPEAVALAAEAVGRHDPGRPLVVDAVPLPAEPLEALAVAAAGAVAGAPATLFTVPAGADPGAAVAPLAVLTRDFTGDLAYDPYSTPAGADAWTFVRGRDLGLRVIARTPRGPGGEPADELALTFSDPQLRRPERVEPASGEAIPLAGARRTAEGLVVRVADPGPVAVLRLERMGVEELGEVAGLEERVEVASERQMPVEEILRRLQAFEDAQERRIRHYSAVNTTHLRFGVGTGVQSFEATFSGPYFFDPETGADWAWQDLHVNGVRWRGPSIPEIPLVQPEKVATMPLEITFDKTYTYRLRGTEVVEGRDAWVVEFAPAAAPAAGDGAATVPGGRSLYRGTVWVDRGLYARVRTRAVQLGLEGEVISNEETLFYRPIDDAGETAPWRPESLVLPLRVVSQQLLSVVNATTLVEREALLTEVRVNGDDFAERRAAVTATDVTMLRDTERGLRYLVHQEGVEGRVVKEGYDTDKWFVVGGVFWDDALDFPLPLGGVNYLDLDFRDRGAQLNVFFAGALLTANLAQPRLAGSRFDAGADLFAIAVPLTDTVYRDGEEVDAEEVESLPASLGLKLGRPVGSFFKVSGEYRLQRRDYGRTDETADGFALPADHWEHSLGLSGRFVRSGYSLGLDAGYSLRSEWTDWGPAAAPVAAAANEDFLYWGASLAKTWHLPRFQKVGAEVAYVDGSDLDRFSKYGFGFFGDTRVHGYQSNRVRAESAWAVHGSYGFEVGELLRLDALGDVAWATDEESGLDGEVLAGVGVAGTFVGPWQTLVNVDLGVPVAGPDDGFVAYLVFLKLFR